MTYSIFHNIKNEIEYIDIELEENILNNIYLRLGPACSDSDKIIVDSLLKRFTNNGQFEKSNLDGMIRNKTT